MADQKSLHWACNRHISTVGSFLLGKTSTTYVIVGRVYPWPQWDYISFFHGFSEPSGSIPCVASSAITWVNLPSVGGQPTRIQSRQWAWGMQQTLCPWWNYPTLQNKLDSSTRVNSFRCWGLLLDYSGMEELLPDPSLSHLDYGSKSYDLESNGTSMSGICYSIAKLY